MPVPAIDLANEIGCRRDPAAKSLSFFATRPVSVADARLLDQLSSIAQSSGSNVRLCLHPGPESPLQEMIICQRAEAFFPPKRHPNKAKSFAILRGVLGVFQFQAAGALASTTVLRDGMAVICRVEPGVFHTDIPLSATAIHHEVTVGPFAGDADREMAPWGPARSDSAAMSRFRVELLARAGLAGAVY